MKAWMPPVLFAAMLVGPPQAGGNPEVWVSPGGDDNSAGTREQPFATLERARDAVRDLRENAVLPPAGVTVWLRGGTYPRTVTFTLGAVDSGTAGAPVMYAAAPGERAVLLGGAHLHRDSFLPVRDPAVLERIISEQARDRVLQVDLAAHGIKDYGELSRRGFHKARSGEVAPLELYVNGARMTLARWPNPGDDMGETLSRDAKGRRGVVGRSGIVEKGPLADDPDFWDRGGAFTYDFDRPALWQQAQDIWLDGVFSWSWEWSYNKVQEIDHGNRRMTLRYGEVSGLTDRYSGDFFFAENLLEEIDEPGEYYLNRATGILYLLPPEGFFEDTPEIVVTMLRTPMITVTGASHITFRDLTLTYGRNAGAICSGGESVRFERCEVSNLAGTGISVTGSNHQVAGCHIHHVGGAGVALNGGDPSTLEPGGCFVEDSHIHHFARYHKVYTPAVSLGYRSAGNRVSHNLIHNGPHLAIVVYGNDHLIEYNDIHDVVQDFTDMGAIYANLGATPLDRGTVIRRNYFHHIGQERHLQIGVYPDNGTMGWTIEENVFHRIGGTGQASNSPAVHNNTGAHILTRNNIFVDCTIPYRLNMYSAQQHYDRMRERWERVFADLDLAAMPHGEKYPELLRFWDEPRQFPESNTFERNLVYNPTVPLLRQFARTPLRDGAVDDGDVLQLRDNWVAEEDPGFVDAAAGDLDLREDAPVFDRIPGFQAIPFSEIGPRRPAGPHGHAG